MRFGLTGKRTGAHAYTLAFRIASLLPLPYIFVLAGYAGLAARRGVLSFLFELGCAALPRWETLLLSAVYTGTNNEMPVYFILLAVALVFGLVTDRLLRAGEKTARAVRIAFCVLIAADLILRACSPRFSAVFGAGVSVAGFAFRLSCLALPVLDLIFDKKRKEGSL